MDGPGIFVLLWLAVALGATVVEILTVDFFFLMLAGGALLTALPAGLGAPVPIQVLTFAITSAGLLYGARPPLKAWVRNTPGIAMNAAALVGAPARVLETVTDHHGRIKLAGEVWTARLAPGERSLEVGSAVHVVRLDGATALVAADTNPPQSPEGRPTP